MFKGERGWLNSAECQLCRLCMHIILQQIQVCFLLFLRHINFDNNIACCNCRLAPRLDCPHSEVSGTGIVNGDGRKQNIEDKPLPCNDEVDVSCSAQSADAVMAGSIWTQSQQHSAWNNATSLKLTSGWGNESKDGNNGRWEQFEDSIPILTSSIGPAAFQAETHELDVLPWPM